MSSSTSGSTEERLINLLIGFFGGVIGAVFATYQAPSLIPLDTPWGPQLWITLMLMGGVALPALASTLISKRLTAKLRNRADYGLLLFVVSAFIGVPLTYLLCWLFGLGYTYP
jgi:hypothetical protein